jgi:RNA polymerase sigma-70 factor (ECF subfamily)
VKIRAEGNHSENDHLLIRQSMEGDLAAFRGLVENHQHFIYSVAFRTLMNKEDAEDVVQETFIKVWLNLKYFNFQGKFTTWLYRIAVNQCLDRLKCKRRRNIDLDSSAESKNLFLLSDQEPEYSEEKDIADHIRNLAEQLSPKQRMVFILRDIQDLSIEEVCRYTQLSEGSVKTNLYHARNTIRLKLKESGDL